jgi:hypothetical protein
VTPDTFVVSRVRELLLEEESLGKWRQEIRRQGLGALSMSGPMAGHPAGKAGGPYRSVSLSQGRGELSAKSSPLPPVLPL